MGIVQVKYRSLGIQRSGNDALTAQDDIPSKARLQHVEVPQTIQ